MKPETESKSRLLLNWYQNNKRPLPWRDQDNVYWTLVSEIMLQQTRVEAVKPIFLRFIKRFTDFESLAMAEESEVFFYWQGLGYYRRAKNLHQCARQIVKMAGVPKTKDQWILLPGIGDYTASAIASIAFLESVPVLDGNVIRIATRIFGIFGDPTLTGIRKEIKKRVFEDLFYKDSPGDSNQSMMELGATVCLPKNPLCDQCPLNSLCFAYQNQKVSDLPELKTRVKKDLISLSLYLFRDKDNKPVLGTPWRGYQSDYIFPVWVEGEAVKKYRYAGYFRHNITNYNIMAHVYFEDLEVIEQYQALAEPKSTLLLKALHKAVIYSAA
ncbi:MAG: A/G-specific adenine glycosylase [Candidatus Cloacimonetes bacterium]|nr:A/G-specific adenine glycosylase [Candidatus Cloacimonadota bacterium]